MKFDRFLAALFSRRCVVIICLVLIVAFCLTACEYDPANLLEDIICLSLFGCVSFDTCNVLIDGCFYIISCEWLCDSCGNSSGGEDDNVMSCVGEEYNGCFNCFWDSCLKDCRPSTVCDKCEGSSEDDGDGGCSEPRSCDDCMLDCLDSCLTCIESNG